MYLWTPTIKLCCLFKKSCIRIGLFVWKLRLRLKHQTYNTTFFASVVKYVFLTCLIRFLLCSLFIIIFYKSNTTLAFLWCDIDFPFGSRHVAVWPVWFVRTSHAKLASPHYSSEVLPLFFKEPNNCSNLNYIYGYNYFDNAQLKIIW